MSKYSNSVKRTYFFNLATIDATYLEELHSRFYLEGAEWQRSLLNLVHPIFTALKGLDINQFDQGRSYDFTPLLVTIGRVDHMFNQIKSMGNVNNAAFLHPMLEHLEVIRMHINFVQDPLQHLDNKAPISHLWAHFPVIFEAIKEKQISTTHIAHIVSLFPFFNLDAMRIRGVPGLAEGLEATLKALRQEIIATLNRAINKFAGNLSVSQKVIQEHHFDTLFPYQHYVQSQKKSRKKAAATDAEVEAYKMSKDEIQFYEKGSEVSQEIYLLREALQLLPGSFQFMDSNFEFTQFISKRFMGSLAQDLINKINTSSHAPDDIFDAATQFVWTIYKGLLSSYPEQLVNTRFAHSVHKEQNQISLFEQAALFKSEYRPPPPPPLDERGNQKEPVHLLTMYERRLQDFLRAPTDRIIYRPHAKTFDKLENGVEFSYETFYNIALTLCLSLYWFGAAGMLIFLLHALSFAFPNTFKSRPDTPTVFSPFCFPFIYRHALSSVFQQESLVFPILKGLQI